MLRSGTTRHLYSHNNTQNWDNFILVVKWTCIRYCELHAVGNQMF